MANHPERLVRSTAHRNGSPPLVSRPLVYKLALFALVSACGVQEHAHELKADISVGGKLAPPPPPPESGGTPSLSGGTTGVPGAGGTPTGAGGGGGVPAGGFGGTLNPAGGAGLPGGSTSTGGTPTNAGVGGMVTQGGTPGAGGSVAMAGAPSTGGLSGVMVDINGTKLPKESVIAFIHVGHSNMAGRAMSPASSRAYHFENEPSLRTWIYRAGNWTVATEPNTAGDQESKRFMKGGPGTALLKQALDDAPTRYFVSLGFGIASAYCSQFIPGGLYYDQLIAAPKELKGQVTFGAILIMLGITERHGTAADISGYPNCINTLVTAIRNDVGEPNLPLLINDYEMEATGSELGATSEFAQQMIPLIHKIPEIVSNSALVPTDNLPMEDDHHFNFDGQKEWTRRALDIMKQKGWVKW